MPNAEQAVILAAGRGTRLQRPDPSVTLEPEVEAIVQQGIKALVPILGRPFMDYSIQRLMEAGISRVCLIIAPGAAPLEEYVKLLPQRFQGLHAEWVIQLEAKGTAHALRFARAATGDCDFLMLNSDNLYPVSALTDLAQAPAGACYAVGFDRESLVHSSNFGAARISQLGILVPEKEHPDRLERVVEKPENPHELERDGKLWVTMNVWRFLPAIYDFCDRVAVSTRGEYEIPSAVQDISNSGIPVKMLRCSDGVLDLTSRADIKHLEDYLKS